MGTFIKNENEITRNDYYYRILEDVRGVFINYGRYLERNNIPDEGTIEDYEEFLMFYEAKQKEFEDTELDHFKDFANKHYETMSQETLEYTDLCCFLINNTEEENDIAINYSENYEKEQWDKAVICQADDFYDKFEEMTCMDMWDFEKMLISFTYANEMENSANLIINIDAEIKRFVLDVI